MMNTKPSIVLLFLAILFFATPKAEGSRGGYPLNASDPEVQQDGAFAVAEYNKKTTEHLEFITVVNASREVQSDPNAAIAYQVLTLTYLVLEAKNCSQPDHVGLYRTLLYEIKRKQGHGGSTPLTMQVFQSTNCTADDNPFL